MRGFPKLRHLIQHGKQVEFVMPIPLRPDFDASALRAIAKKTKDGAQARRLLALAAIYEGGSRTQAAAIWQRHVADRAGLGDQVQCRGSRRPDRPQATWPALTAERHAPGGADPRHRGRSDAGDPRRGALAPDRSVPMAVGGVSRQHRQARAQPGTARAGISQAHRAAAPSCAG